jgi:hypothetical protein
MPKLSGRIHYTPSNKPGWAKVEFPFYVEELSDGYLRIVPPNSKYTLTGIARPTQGFAACFYLENKSDLELMTIDRVAWELLKFMPDKKFVLVSLMVFAAIDTENGIY